MTSEHLFNSARLLIKKFSLLVKEINSRGLSSELIQLKTIINEERSSLNSKETPTSISSMINEKKEEMIYPLEIE